MIKVGIAGGRGYVGQELLQLLSSISEYTIEFVGSKSLAGKKVAEHTGCESNLLFQALTPTAINAADVDVWIIAQANGQAASFVQELHDKTLKLIDVSSDYRFDDEWCYGLIESNSQQIAHCNRASNPGCYATAAQLTLLPLRKQIVDAPSVFGISGYSGAGKTPNPRNDPQNLKDNLLPYSLTGHTHELEISRHLGTQVRFAPHVASFFRGISVTVNAKLQTQVHAEELLQQFVEYYQTFPLVDVQLEIPEVRNVVESNRAIVGGFAVDQRDRRRITLVCAIDNLRKGAASQIVQNLNLMFGLPAEHGLN